MKDENKPDFFDTLIYNSKFKREEAKKVYATSAVSELKRLINKTTLLEQYKEGDILVRRRYGGKYETMGDNTTKVKYEIVHITDERMVFAKKFLNSGGIGKQLFCLNIDSHDYEIDPDLVDHILLDEEDSYDPAETIAKMNKKKKQLRSINNKTILRGSTIKGRKYIVDNFNIGDNIYTAWGMMGQGTKEYVVTDKTSTSVTIEPIKQSGYWKESHTITLSASAYYNFWEQKPKTMEDIG